MASSVIRLGLNKDKTVEVPKDPDDAGWYRKGPIPGQNGSSVILGHVDSKTGPAVFYRLKNLDPGDQIAVELSDDTVAHYRVARVARYANRTFQPKRSTPGRPTYPHSTWSPAEANMTETPVDISPTSSSTPSM